MSDLQTALKVLDGADVELLHVAWESVKAQYERKLGAVPVAVQEHWDALSRSSRELIMD